VLPSFSKLSRSAKLLRFYQRSGLQSLARATGLLKAMGVAELDELSPRIESDFSFRDLGKVFPAEGERRGRVALLIGCVSSVAFAELNRATIRVLTKNGIEVCIPQEQSCCGALHAHAGDLEVARRLARTNIAAFEASHAEHTAVNAAGCGAMLKEYGHLLAHDRGWAARASDFSARVRDVSELLADAGPVKGALLPLSVTYDAPCHLLHAQRVARAPLQVLEAIPGLVIKPLMDSDQCCGAAGIYNLVEPGISQAVLAPKLRNIGASEAAYVVTGNPGCLMQIGAGLRHARMTARVAHPVDLLDASYAMRTFIES
jgi:glycolate oxidase iron-sulfur subunit